MKLKNNILIVFVGIIYFVSSSGIVIYKSNCSCTGNEQISVYVQPGTCETEFHQHHQHDTNGDEICTEMLECHECSNHADHCGCSSPEVNFFKLTNLFLDEEVLYVKVAQTTVPAATFIVWQQFLFDVEMVENDDSFIDPPPISISSIHFLVQIQQLKIPDIA